MSNDQDGVVKLLSEKGEWIEFHEIAGIKYQGNFYALLQPVELLDGMGDDEALVFKVSRGEDGQDKFEIVLDDATVDGVFKEYDRLYDDAHAGPKVSRASGNSAKKKTGSNGGTSDSNEKISSIGTVIAAFAIAIGAFIGAARGFPYVLYVGIAAALFGAYKVFTIIRKK